MAEPIRCERTIRRAIARGDLPAYRLGNRGGKLIRLRADDVDRFMRPPYRLFTEDSGLKGRL